MKTKPRICIAGMGPLGKATALLCAQNGFDVTLIDKYIPLANLHIPDYKMHNPGMPAFILHNDGIEYFRKNNPNTGYHCIDGGIALQLFYGPNLLSTDVAHHFNRIRFFLSSESAKRIEPSDFLGNADLMKKRYGQKYAYLKDSYGWNESEAMKILHGHPEGFTRTLYSEEHPDVVNVACGVEGSGLGLDFQRFDALTEMLLQKHQDSIRLIQGDIKSVSKGQHGYNFVMEDNTYISADYGLYAAGYSNPSMAYRTEGAIDSPSGYYFLNCMSEINLPALGELNLSVAERVRLFAYLNKINFTLQGPEAGASFVCIKPPTRELSGKAVSYVPRMDASQHEEYAFSFKNGDKPPAHFENIIHNGQPPELELPRKKQILEALCHYYPFLQGYIKVEDIKFRYGVVYSPHGRGVDRNQREIVGPVQVTDDGKIISAHAGKFTTHVVHAFEMLDYFIQQSQGRSLPKVAEADEAKGFGPNRLDLAKALAIDNASHVNCYMQKEMIRLSRAPFGRSPFAA